MGPAEAPKTAIKSFDGGYRALQEIEEEKAMKRPKTTCLQGDPGTGKSMMAGLTAVNKPVHFVDVDRKILSAEWAQEALAKNEITVWELEEPVDKSGYTSRMYSLIKKNPPPVQPLGWTKFGEYFNAHDDPNWIKAGTVVIDSATALNEHLKAHISYIASKGRFEFDQWGALKSGWMDTMSALRDLHRQHGKDLVITVHERDKAQPGNQTLAARQVQNKDNIMTIYEGPQDVKVWASIDGAYGDLIGSQMDEYYYLYIVAEDPEKPQWRCRVLPDGKRSLRTSFKARQAVYACDFREIWR